jgi:hypothetical protein
LAELTNIGITCRAKEPVILSFAKDLLFGFDSTRLTADSSLTLRMTAMFGAYCAGVMLKPASAEAI